MDCSSSTWKSRSNPFPRMVPRWNMAKCSTGLILGLGLVSGIPFGCPLTMVQVLILTVLLVKQRRAGVTGLVCTHISIHDGVIMTDRTIEVTVKNNLRWNGTSVRFPNTFTIPIVPPYTHTLHSTNTSIRSTGMASANLSLSTWTASTE